MSVRLMVWCVQIVPEDKEHMVDDDFDRYRFAVLPIIGELEHSTWHGLSVSEHKVSPLFYAAFHMLLYCLLPPTDTHHHSALYLLL